MADDTPPPPPTTTTTPATIPNPSTTWIHAQNAKGATRARASVPPADLRGRWILVSGANSGIGRAAAVRLAAWGAHLVLACRPDPPATEPHPSLVVAECVAAARGAGHAKSVVEWWEVDFADLASVERLAERWVATGRALDVLCNNAGIGSSPGGSGGVCRTGDGFEVIHQVNFLSHVLLTLRLLPSLARAPAPRIVCTTSCFHYLGAFDLANFNAERGGPGAEGVRFYMNNKLYFQVWLAELQRRLLARPRLRHVTVQGVHPGYVNSGIWNLNGADWLGPVKSAVARVMAWLFGISEEQGALAILHAAVSEEAGPDPRVQGVGGPKGRGGGRYWNRVWEEEPMPHVRDRGCGLAVWRKVDEELGLREKGLLDVLGTEL